MCIADGSVDPAYQNEELPPSTQSHFRGPAFEDIMGISTPASVLFRLVDAYCIRKLAISGIDFPPRVLIFRAGY